MPVLPGPRLRSETLARLILAYPRSLVLVAVLLSMLGAGLAAKKLQLDADTNQLIAEDRPFMPEFLGWLAEFGDLEYLYVVVDPRGDEPAATAAIRMLVPRLRAVDGVPEVHGWITNAEQWRLAPWAMPIEELQRLADTGKALSVLKSDESAATVLREGLGRLNRLENLGAVTLSEADRRVIGAEGILLLESMTATPLSGINSLDVRTGDGLGIPRPTEFLVNPGGRLRFIEVLPRKDFGRLDAIAAPLAAIRSTIEEVQTLHPSIQIGITGKPVLQADELATSDADMTRCAGGAFVLIALIFLRVFRGVRRPLLIIIAFACAFGWTYGFATLAVGRLNLLSIVFMLVLVGVGLDYGVHVTARWVEARRRGRSVMDAINETISTAGVGNFYGAATSAGVFLLGLMTDFGGLRELGLIAGGGLLLCMIAMVVVLPALLVIFDSGPSVPESNLDADASPSAPRSPGPMIALVGLATLAFGAVALERARFENNLLELQAVGLESVQWERRVLADSTSASWFAASIADSIEEVEDVIAAASRHPEIGAIRSVLDLVPPPDEDRATARRRLATAIEAEVSLTVPKDDRRPIAEDFRQASITTNRLATFARDRDPSAAERLAAISSRMLAFADGLDGSNAEANEIRSSLDRSRNAARIAVESMSSGARGDLRSALPSAVRNRLIASSGRYMVSLVPSEDIWEPEPMKRFVEAVRAIDPKVTGVPITQYESLRDMRRSFLTMSSLAVILVVVLVWIDFRRLGPVVMAVTVLGVGLIWTIGLTAAIGVHLNVANFFAIPILIGIGIDSAIHMLHRADECGEGPLDFRGTRGAVILTSITTGIGFGSLLFASHQGLQSLGAMMAIGSLSCLASTVVLLPALLRLTRSRSTR